MQLEMFQQPQQKLYSTDDMARAFNRHPMTIYHWRRFKEMPCIVLPTQNAHAVRFVENDVRRWASVHGFKVVDESVFNPRKD